MRQFLWAGGFAAALMGCAQSEIGTAEQRARAGDPALSVRSLTQFTDLKQLGDYAQNNAFAYADAANNIQRFQDVATLIVIGAAGTAVTWAANGVSDAAVGRVATAGVASEISGRRYASKQTIQGVLTGAKRLNCVGFYAHVQHATSGANPPQGAVEATRAAIIHIQLKTREALVREQETFEGIFDEFKSETSLREGLAPPQRVAELEKYVKNLQKCVAQAKGELPDNPELQ